MLHGLTTDSNSRRYRRGQHVQRSRSRSGACEQRGVSRPSAVGRRPRREGRL
ncbi:hypothetical protein ACFQL4_20455 [Halosimplex aquaticum]